MYRHLALRLSATYTSQPILSFFPGFISFQMSSNSLNRASTDGRHFDLDIFEKIIHHLISQELKTVKLISSPWIDILRATNDPEIAGPILRRIEDDCVMYEHVMSQSVNQIESVIHRVSSRMLRHAENAKDSVRNHRDRLGLGQRISPPAEPVTTSNTTYIDLTGPSCRVCGGSIEGSRATVYDRCGCVSSTFNLYWPVRLSYSLS